VERLAGVVMQPTLPENPLIASPVTKVTGDTALSLLQARRDQRALRWVLGTGELPTLALQGSIP